MAKSNVYTRTGDDGTTAIVGGHRIWKTDVRIEAYGTVDELNAQIGLLCAYLLNTSSREFLQKVQSDLFTIGSYLATDTSKNEVRPQSIVRKSMIEALEKRIDEIDAKLPKTPLFILPGGARSAALCHVCRTVCRRAERCILHLAGEVTIEPNVLSYINRLSDYFFVLARKLNIDEGKAEMVWHKPVAATSAQE